MQYSRQSWPYADGAPLQCLFLSEPREATLENNWYIVATQDRTVQPEPQRFVSKRMGAKVTEIASSHVPMLSKPELVIDVIRTAAKAVQARATVA